MSDSRVRIARRVAKFLQNGDLVNLGIGRPTLVANYLPEGLEVEFQSENGLIGLGGAPEAGQEDQDITNAGAQPATLGMGGAMDLVAGAKTVIVAMEHCTKAGASKVLKHCTLPLTASRRVKYIVTELAVLKVTEHGLELMETAPGVTPGEVQEKTEATLLIPDTVGCME